MIPAPLKESDFVKAFLSIMLCSAFGGALVGDVMGGILGAAFGTAGGSINSLRVAAPVLGGLAGIVVTYFFFRFIRRFVVRWRAPLIADG